MVRSVKPASRIKTVTFPMKKIDPVVMSGAAPFDGSVSISAELITIHLVYSCQARYGSTNDARRCQRYRVTAAIFQKRCQAHALAAADGDADQLGEQRGHCRQQAEHPLLQPGMGGQTKSGSRQQPLVLEQSLAH
jgi:hypothetical protein